MANGYWVYENWTQQRIRVHQAGCTFCNDGKGIGRGTNGTNDAWYGRFATRDSAWLKVGELPSRRRGGDWDIADCKNCA